MKLDNRTQPNAWFSNSWFLQNLWKSKVFGSSSYLSLLCRHSLGTSSNLLPSRDDCVTSRKECLRRKLKLPQKNSCFSDHITRPIYSPNKIRLRSNGWVRLGSVCSIRSEIKVTAFDLSNSVQRLSSIFECSIDYAGFLTSKAHKP